MISRIGNNGDFRDEIPKAGIFRGLDDVVAKWVVAKVGIYGGLGDSRKQGEKRDFGVVFGGKMWFCVGGFW
jgi:hypothetical protein